MSLRLIILTVAISLLQGFSPLFADDYRIDEKGELIKTAEPDPDSQAGWIARIRTLLADGKNAAAENEASKFIKKYKDTGEPLYAEAVLLRGDAQMARGNFYKALYDYEYIAREFPVSEQFTTALQREYLIAEKFAAGLKKKWAGIRLFNAEEEAVELLIRIQERLRGSRLAEQAGITLADYFYRKRLMHLALDSYDLFLLNYPDSPYRQKAMQRKIFAHIATFKGPEYDASGLENAKLEIEEFKSTYPRVAAESGVDNSLLGWINDSAAEKMLHTAQWYLAQNDPVSAQFTLKRMIRKYPETAAGKKAIALMLSHGWIKKSATESTDYTETKHAHSDIDIDKNTSPKDNTSATDENK